MLWPGLGQADGSYDPGIGQARVAKRGAGPARLGLGATFHSFTVQLSHALRSLNIVTVINCDTKGKLQNHYGSGYMR